MLIKKGKSCSNGVNVESAKQGKGSACSICGQPATELVDDEPSCKDHIEQIYQHQEEDYTRARLRNNEWGKV